jgi:TIR domain-containing protein
MAFPVFTSYAQENHDKFLKKFVLEFRTSLAGFQGLHGGEDAVKAVAFFDRDVPGGGRWSPAILAAVREARVLVCLMSHTYLRRPWCGRELQVFLERDQALPRPAGTEVTFVFPIWWQKPRKPRPLPSKLDQFKWSHETYPKQYEAQGVWGIARHSSPQVLRKMADELAELVHETLEGALQLPVGAAVVDVETIINAFDEQQDFDVRLLALTLNGPAWQPGPTDPTVAAAAEEATRKLEIFSREVDQSAGLTAGLQKAQSEQQIILLVVEPASAPAATLAAINGLVLPNLSVLIVESGGPALDTEAWLAGLGLPQGSLASAKAAGLVRTAGPGALTAEMQRLLDDADRHLSPHTQPAKAESFMLTEDAKAQGIDVSTQPHLGGPAANSQI